MRHEGSAVKVNDPRQRNLVRRKEGCLNLVFAGGCIRRHDFDSRNCKPPLTDAASVGAYRNVLRHFDVGG